MAQELGFFLHEGALAQLGIEAILAEEGKDTTNVSQVLSLSAGVDEDVIKIDNN